VAHRFCQQNMHSVLPTASTEREYYYGVTQIVLSTCPMIISFLLQTLVFRFRNVRSLNKLQPVPCPTSSLLVLFHFRTTESFISSSIRIHIIICYSSSCCRTTRRRAKLMCNITLEKKNRHGRRRYRHHHRHICILVLFPFLHHSFHPTINR
jgi:hypothetical protein